MLVHAVVNGDGMQIDNRFPRGDRRSAIAIHPTDGSCWVTDAFQGRVTRHAPQHKTTHLTGFAAPVALVLHPRTNTFWIADAALHVVAEVPMTGKTLQRIEIRSPKALAIGPDGNCWVLTWRGIQPIITGQAERPIQKKIKFIANTPDVTALWSVSRKELIYRFDADGIQRLPFALPDCKGVAGTPDGECWLIISQQAIRISNQMVLVGEVTGFNLPKTLIVQPTDSSIWVIGSGYHRAIRLPEPDTLSANQLVALTGWEAVVRDGEIKREVVSDFYWESYLTTEPARPPLTGEPPKQDTPPPPYAMSQPDPHRF